MCSGIGSYCWLSSAGFRVWRNWPNEFLLILMRVKQALQPTGGVHCVRMKKWWSSQTLVAWEFHRLLHSLIISRLPLHDWGLMGSLDGSPFRFHSAVGSLNRDRALRRFCLLPCHVSFPISYSFCSNFDLAKPDPSYLQRHLSSFFQCYIQKLLS